MNRTSLLLFGGLVVVLGAFPYLGVSSYVVSLASTILVAAILAASVNFLAGNGALVSLGHGSIAAAAAYGAAWASKSGYGMATQVLVALAVTLVVSVAYGLVSMRTEGIYFIMVTLAVGQLIYGLAFRASPITGGENGIANVPRPEILGEYWMFYLFLVGAFALATALLWVISNSPFGASLRGIRDSETRMRSLGYNVAAYKFSAILMSGSLAGFAGLLSVWHTHFVSPSSANVHRSILLIVMVILGGLGTTTGPLIGAGVVVLVEQVLSNTVERWPTVLGVIFILTILFARAGIIGSLNKAINRVRRRRNDPTDGPPPEPQPEPLASGTHP